MNPQPRVVRAFLATLLFLLSPRSRDFLFSIWLCPAMRMCVPLMRVLPFSPRPPPLFLDVFCPIKLSWSIRTGMVCDYIIRLLGKMRVFALFWYLIYAFPSGGEPL